MKAVRTINFVARQTGLSVHTIRAWEKRHGAVTPVRGEHARRLYSEKDVERLKLLKAATKAGHSIGQIASLPVAALRTVLRGVPANSETKRDATQIVPPLISSALETIRAFDGPSLDDLLDRSAAELGSPAVLQKFIVPLTSRVGEMWRAGEFAIAHEHFITNHVTNFLANFARPYSENMNAPHLAIATPTGQLHELGAIIVCAAARSHGWRTTYLGASLPMEEFAGAMQNLQPRAVGLSIVFPPDDLVLKRDLVKLRKLLPRDCALIVGGRSAASYTAVLRQIKAIVVDTLEDLYPVLDKLSRTQATKS
ncbi:MAG: MerR family transcriptional regulator [Verrucomicrobiota bacterium]|nr:MerR family transcriptional regulator [Verrucomicrobiota bacterium]